MTVADSPEDDVPREVLRRRRRSRRRGQDSHGAEDTRSTHPVRRLVLVQSQQSPAVPAPRPFDREYDNPGFEEDTETVDGVSVGDDEGGFAATPVEVPPMIERPVRGLQGAFASLDGVDLKDRFKFRVCVMRTVPCFMKGAFRLGLRAVVEEVLAGFTQRSDVRMARGWKSFMFLPRIQATTRRWSAQEEVGGTSPIVPEWPVVAVVGEKLAGPPRYPHEGVGTRRTVLRREQNEPEILYISESCR